MKAIVNSIIPNSIAKELNIYPGDEIVSIDAVKPLDLIDYRYLISSESLSLHIKRISGEEEIIDIEKDQDEDIGIIFESAVFDAVKPCRNKCIFCFVDQQPQGLRDSLYVKDDDYRLSYLQGTYITLTNLTSHDKKRIEALGLGPLYVSVHTTNPELRHKMLKNPRAKAIMEDLQWLNKIGIPVHTQIVICPGINDRVELEKTLKDLSGFKNILSIAVVPVGVTKYRQEPPLIPPNKEQAKGIIAITDKYSLAFPSDELYITAGYELPKKSFYKGFAQLDDGVGAGRVLLDDYKKYKKQLPKSLNKPLNLTIAAGRLACQLMRPIIEDLNKINNLNIELVPVNSSFWGENVTVSGLITGQDLLDTLLPRKDSIKTLLLPSVMLRKYTDQFLDNLTITDIEQKLDINVIIVQNYYSTKEMVDFICSQK
ncbi:MAG: hypothetical protein A2Y25_02885 [Candidatus Melainabacteria bacterium GWF2_37_15]|nr:MAG: hypothetical protein A2Y25_02885 [Candidatus Melainabacteria bacterium GWF2_37_15]